MIKKKKKKNAKLSGSQEKFFPVFSETRKKYYTYWLEYDVGMKYL